MGRKRNWRVIVGMCAVLALGTSALGSAAVAAGPTSRGESVATACKKQKKALTAAKKALEKAEKTKDEADKDGDLDAYKEAEKKVAKAEKAVEAAQEKVSSCRADEEERVRLEPINTLTRRSFTEPAGEDQEVDPVTVEQPTAIDPSTVGIYGGTLNKAECDKEQLKTFLQQNRAQAEAWAGVHGITVQELPAFIDALTPVTLRSDTLVTNHDFRNGKAVPLQSVVQAGTAVLVDEYGTPVTKCYCGNPLLPPTYTPPRYPPNTTTTTYYNTTTTTYYEPPYEPPYYGPKWPTWRPPGITVVEPGPLIPLYTLYDIQTGKTFTRPAGSDGSADAPTTTASPRQPSSPRQGSTTTTTYPRNTTTTTYPRTTTTKDPYCYENPPGSGIIICA